MAGKSRGFNQVENSRKRYQARKAAGLCVMCDAKPDPGRTYCPGCIAKQTAKQAARKDARRILYDGKVMQARQERLNAGLCGGCGDSERYTATDCRKCEAARLMQETGVTRHVARRTVGLCQKCPNVREPDKEVCMACFESRRVREQKNKERLTCCNCGGVNDRPDCRDCNACAARKKDVYDDLVTSRVCPDCRKQPAADGLKRCETCNEKTKERNTRKTRKLRAMVLAAYGGECKCCGETTPEFLQVDHVFNDGAAHRRQVNGTNVGGAKIYPWLKKNGFPQDRFQLLCASCNTAKAFYGECPHERQRREALEKLTPETSTTEDSTL